MSSKGANRPFGRQQESRIAIYITLHHLVEQITEYERVLVNHLCTYHQCSKMCRSFT